MRMIRRLPKRGFKSPGGGRVFIPVNVEALNEFADGTEVTPAVLMAAGLARGAGEEVKILGAGELKKKLMVKVQAFSASARAKIESAGGTCEVVGSGNSRDAGPGG